MSIPIPDAPKGQTNYVSAIMARVDEEAAREREAKAEKKREEARRFASHSLRGRIEAAKAGRIPSGPTPFGYMRREKRAPVEAHPTNGPIVQAIYREYLRQRSMKQLVRWLRANHPGPKWSRAKVAWILKNTVYLGYVHFGEIKRRGLHPALISPIIFNKVQVLMRKNDKRSRGMKAKAEAVLSELGKDDEE